MGELRQSIDLLGQMRNYLRDLQGHETLLFELIQNADDAPGVTELVLTLTPDAFVVANNGSFREEDFQRLLRIASGGKREERGTTGAFGIGFIAVYQVTDHPQICSSGKCWILNPEADGRVDETPISDDGCTKLVLPWATDATSPVRKGLALPSVNINETIAALQGAAERILPEALLFLRKLDRVALVVDGTLRLKATRRIVADQVELTSNGENTVYRLLHGHFHAAATEYRRLRPGTVESKRTSSLFVAIPVEGTVGSGTWCATLPTQMATGGQLWIQADFMLTTSRKEFGLEAGAAGDWNRLAAAAAGKTIADNAALLCQQLGDSGFWSFVASTRNADQPSANGLLWDQLAPVLPGAHCLLVHSGERISPRDATFLRGSSLDDVSEVLDELEVFVPHDSVAAHRNLLSAEPLSVPVLTVKGLTARLANGNLWTSPTAFWRTDIRRRQALARLIDGLLGAENTSQESRAALASQPIALAADGQCRPPRKLYHAPANVVELLSSIGLSRHFLGLGEPSLEQLTLDWSVDAGVGLLKTVTPEEWNRLWSIAPAQIRGVWEWLARYRADLPGRPDLRRSIGSLCIWPSSGGLRPLETLVVPGSFSDPLGLALILDKAALGTAAHLLDVLDVAALDLRTYVVKQLPGALADHKGVPPQRLRELVMTLAHHRPEIASDEEARHTLTRLALVECDDGTVRAPAEVYWTSAGAMALLGEVPVASRAYQDDAACRELLEWLGVSSRPKLNQILDLLDRITSGPVERSALNAFHGILEYLGTEYQRGDDATKRQLEYLKKTCWLPVRGDSQRWYAPKDVFTCFQDYLFETTGRFLDIGRKQQSSTAALLDWLGLTTEPPMALVVKHALTCATTNHSINVKVYEFLGGAAEPRDVRALREAKCISLADGNFSPSEVFWDHARLGTYARVLPTDLRPHQKFFDLVGVKRVPGGEDGLRILRRVADDRDQDNRPLPEALREVVMECWRLLEQDGASEDYLAPLVAHKVIPTGDGILEYPANLFFDDRPGLAAKFGSYLRGSVIERPEGAHRAMAAAGVRTLSQVMVTEVVEAVDVERWPEIESILKERIGPLKRVCEQRRDLEERPRWELWGAITAFRCQRLSLATRVAIFGGTRQSAAEPGRVHYDASTQHLMVVPQASIPWQPIGRELMYMLLPGQDTGALALAAATVLASGSVEEANATLDDAGFAQLELANGSLAQSQTGEAAISLPRQCDGTELDSMEHPPAGTLRAVQVLTEGQYSGPMAAALDAEAIGAATEGNSRALENGQLVDLGREAASGTTPADHEGLDYAAVAAEAEGTEAHPTRYNGRCPEASRQEGTPRPGGQQSNAGGKQRRSILYSYVVSGSPSASENGDTAEPAERRTVEEAAIAKAVEYERTQGRTPTVMPPGNEGYDLESTDPATGALRYVEVKGLSGEWVALGVGLTVPEFNWARKQGDSAWLYVVEHATGPTPILHAIRNPAGAVTQYRFDHNWRGLSVSSA
ncbi:MAG: DUF3883 domain-containing protein [Gemmatimonadetes bacterium]|nr:DUF3883 domain-containing protein [Gemmatimonadota bacterium]